MEELEQRGNYLQNYFYKAICIALFSCLSVSSILCQPNQYFENPIILDAAKGLDVGTIYSVALDNTGFLWIAGDQGLQRFDGYYFKTYTPDPNDSTALFSENIRHLWFDSIENKLWISNWNKGGVGFLDLENESFRTYPFEPSSSNGLPDNEIFWTCKDEYGGIWSSVFKHGLVKLNTGSGTFESYKYESHTGEGELDIGSVNSFQCYSHDLENDSILWLGSNAGLIKFNVVNGQFDRFELSSENSGGYNIRSLLSYSNDIFAGTWGRGLFKFNLKTEKFTKCNLDEYSSFGLPGSNIKSIALHSDSRLWLTTNGGILLYDVFADEVLESKNNDLPNNQIYGARYTDQKARQYAWLGNILNIYDPYRQQIKPYSYSPNEDIFKNRVVKIMEGDDPNKLWLAVGFSEGLYSIDLETGIWDLYPPPETYFENRVNFNAWDVLTTQSGETLVLERNAIYSFEEELNALRKWTIQPGIPGAEFKPLIEDDSGLLWVGSLRDGLFRINPQDGQVKQYKEELTGPDKLSPGAIWDLEEDKCGNIWMRNRGYSVYIASRDTIVNFPYFFKDKKSILHIESLGIDGDGNVWVASHEGSIGITNASEPEKGIVEYFDSSKGLRTQKPASFFLDQKENVWILSDAIEIINSNRESSHYYPLENLIDESIIVGIQLSDGRIAFGFDEGIGIFHPDSLMLYPSIPLPYVRAFKVFDKPLEVNLPLSKISEIKLEPDQNFFSLEISALNPRFYGNIEFQYQLEGVDPDWVNPGSRDYIAYTNVKSGQHTFKLKARNNYGNWSGSVYELSIHVLTPWYRTWWAYCIWVGIFISILYLFYTIRLSHQLAKQEARRLKELDAFKSRFYADITHEFRTPLTVIQGMADQLEEEPTTEPSMKLGLIKKNSRSLLNLINQILDLSKLQSGVMKSEIKQDDIIAFIRYLVSSHESLANLKNIELLFHSEEDEIIMDFDASRIERIFTNLISNAIKFTSESGQVAISIEKRISFNKSRIQIKVQDNGIGIPSEEIPFIFDRFHQGTSLEKHRGTGIGLALVKELVEQMNGIIEVESTLGVGSVFIITLPIVNNAVLHSKTHGKINGNEQKVSRIKSQEDAESGSIDDLPTLLIIEDNEDVVYYLKKCLEDSYQIRTAENGLEGIEMAYEIVPDVIVSDVMMPEMDGFEACKILKEDERTSHIPIILLTAKATSDDKLVGLKYGADAYLTKPFEKEELLVRLDRLRAIRKTLQDKYRRTLYYRSSEPIQPQNLEDLFLAKTEHIILEHLEDESFSHEELAQNLALSRSQLHRKLKALSGYSTAIYIRMIRLEKAKELLREDQHTISEIAYKVGFRSPVYFSQIFKKTFGESPSDWMRGERVQD